MSKFQDATCEALWDLSLDGGPDEQCGSVSENGEWYGLLLDTGIAGAEHAIITQNDQGFVEYKTYDSAQEARAEFECIENEIDAEYTE